ncbi:hypothetical protein [Microbacterium sp. AK031]|uniref:hypothetical protein n=1 Tax=Microbacterium sp. AK031 TaxID=2723076 RepID=UPI00216999E1|nr:hypothetical protein [Microbacterium sp. AK031]MCS3844521.1 hypothetical protein [Microbacterium sp. AK031]
MMIENFLRRPQTAGEIIADAVRVFGLLSVVIAAVWFELTDAGVLAFTLPGLLIPRFIGVRAGADVAFCLTLLVAAWSNVFDLYTRIVWWDLAVHFVCTGASAAICYLLFSRLRFVPTPGQKVVLGAVLITTTLGLAMSALWEMVEWFGHAFISEDIFVAYDDTIADMAVGGLGALFAGFAVSFVRLLRPDAVEHAGYSG